MMKMRLIFSSNVNVFDAAMEVPLRRKDITATP